MIFYTILLGLLFLAVLATIAAVVSPVDSVVAPPIVVGFGLLLYSVAIPVEHALTGRIDLGFTGGTLLPIQGVILVGLAITGLVSFSVVYWVTRGDIRPLASLPHGSESFKLPLAYAVGGALLVAVLFPSNVIAAAEYSENIRQTSAAEGSASYFLAVRMSYQTYAAAALAWALYRKPSLVIVGLVASPLVIWGVYSNDKDPILLALPVCAVAMQLRGGGRPSPTFFLRLLRWYVLLPVAALIIGVVTLALTVNRSGAPVFEGVRDSLRSGRLYTEIDPAGPVFVFVHALQSAAPLEYGRTYIEGALLWVPTVFWPGRPIDLATQFAQQTISSYTPGQGFGYSPVAEGLVNFGFVGVAVGFALAGAGFGVLRRLVDRIGGVSVISPIVPLWIVLSSFSAFTYNRGPFSNLVTQAVFSTILVCVILASASLLKGPTSDEDRNGGYIVRKRRHSTSRQRPQ